jgi:UDP-N-acetylglucosamine 2-epimerase (non-hydrolysing)
VIAIVVGTTAELIKIAPVYRSLSQRGADVAIWLTGQHTHEVDTTIAELDLPQPERVLPPAESLVHVARVGQVPIWGSRLVGGSWAQRSDLRRDTRRDGRRPAVMVHGDTFSTVAGALIGKSLGATVIHVEAGLRSGSIASPFPEEINRRIVGRLADINFAPTEREVENLRGSRGEVVHTHGNTVMDSFLMASGQPVGVDLPEEFGIVTLHRYELLRNEDHFAEVIRLLARSAETQTQLIMFAGEAEHALIALLGLAGLFLDRFRLLPKRSYAAFLPCLVRASFVVTDSGGLQEECAALGTPCAVHRARTERHQGLGANVVLTGLQLPALESFLGTWRQLRRESEIGRHQPSELIAETLVAKGF